MDHANPYMMPMQFDPNQMQQNFGFPFQMMGGMGHMPQMMGGMGHMPQMMPMMTMPQPPSSDDKGAQTNQMYYQYMPMNMMQAMPQQPDAKDKQQFVFVQPVFMYPPGMSQPTGDMNNQHYFSPMMPQFMPMYMGGQPDMSSQNENKQQ